MRTMEQPGKCGVCGTLNRFDEVRQTWDCYPLNHGLQTPVSADLFTDAGKPVPYPGGNAR